MENYVPFFSIYLELVQVHFHMKYEVEVFFILWKITHHPSFSVLQTEKMDEKIEA